VILKTGSRGGLIALITVFVYLLFSKSSRLKLSFIAKTALVAVAILSFQYVAINTDRYKSLIALESDYNITDEEGRIAIWNRGLKLMFTHPFTGVGFNQFPHGVGREREKLGLQQIWQTAHNSLIQIGTETGLFGFFLFAVLSFKAFKIFGETAQKSQLADLAEIGVIAKAGFIGLFISSMFLSQAYSVHWAFYIALSAVLKYLLDNECESFGTGS
jgi:O-antigen ligase